MRRLLSFTAVVLLAACGNTTGTSTDDGQCTTASNNTSCTGGTCCNKVCVPTGTSSTCAATKKTCNNCNAPDHGLAACNNGTCTLTCANGYHLCGTTCADDSDVQTCGAACSPCAQVANATSSCSDNQCGFDCNAGWVDGNGVSTDGCERISLAGTVADYPLDGDAKDVSGHGENGTLVGTTPSRDRFNRDGGALHFNATNSDWVRVANDVSLPLGATPRSVTLWFKVDPALPGAVSYEDFFNWGTFADHQRFGVSMRVDNFKLFFTGQNDDVVSNYTPTDGDWHFLSTTYNGTVVALTVDGKDAGVGSVSLNTVGNELRIGRKVDGGNEFLAGDLDDLRIFNRVLDGGELGLLLHEGQDAGH